MQYEITLPGDYDMGIIRERVRTRGAGTDTFPGLGVKAYAIRERGLSSSSLNQYAPMYLWAHQSGMNAFLHGPGFATLSADFGRPPVRHFSGLAFARGPARDGVDQPPALSRRSVRIGPDDDLEAALEAALGEHEILRGTDAVHCTALLCDPATWELTHVTLWATAAPPNAGVRYEVLHVSHPQLDELPEGRLW